MSICIIHLSDGKVAGVYSKLRRSTSGRMSSARGPRMTEEQQARYRAFQTMVKYGLGHGLAESALSCAVCSRICA